MQNTAFYIVKHGLLDGKRWPFAMRKATFWGSSANLLDDTKAHKGVEYVCPLRGNKQLTMKN